MPRITITEAGSKNMLAFLDMIAVSELGMALMMATDDGYNVLVGSTASHPLTFGSYATHPNILNRELNSTAAGRYQLLYRYWVAYSELLCLADFSPHNQDLIALQQITESGVREAVDAGNVQSAITGCSHIWASLPGNSYGQHMNSMSALVSAYEQAGGTVA